MHESELVLAIGDMLSEYPEAELATMNASEAGNFVKFKLKSGEEFMITIERVENNDNE